MTALARVDHHLRQQSLTGGEDECGDVGLVIEDDGQCFLALVDALGHGRQAHAVARIAADFLAENHRQPLVELLRGLHLRLKSTRGAVAALCRLDKGSGQLRYAGMGNISVKIMGSNHRSLVLRDGVLGYMISSPTEQTTSLYPGDVLLLSSDGIREHFSPHDHPQLLVGSARQIVARMIDTFSKQNDDASCIVLRYGV